MDIILRPKTTIRFLALIIIGIVFAHIVRHLLLFYFGRSFGLFMFDLDLEYNIATLYASMMLLLCSLLLFIIAFAKKNNDTVGFLYWLGLASIFLFLSTDEITVIHEHLIGPMRSMFNTSGFLYFAWVIPYSAFLIIFLLAYLRFIISLPGRTRLLFIIAGSVYVTGAVGMELIGGYQADLYGLQTVTYIVITSIEEILEMIGVLIFIYALMSYIGSTLPNLCLRISLEKETLSNTDEILVPIR